MQRVVIIDCGAGNLHSVRKAFASQLPQGASLEVVTDAAALKGATHIVLPGVGAFGDCMAGLLALPGMREALEDAVLRNKIPLFGICVGMQILFERGHEHGVHEGLGWFKGEVRKIAPADASLKVPHMGWNRLRLMQKENPVVAGVADGDHVYFVHSYAASGCAAEDVLATVDYGGPVVAGIGRGNIIATQFHPEKSQSIGLRIIRQFLLH